MKTKVLWSLCLMLTCFFSQAQQKYELTVKEAVDLAWKNVVELKNARLDYQIQEARNKKTLGQALPQISADVQANHYVKLPTILFPQSEEGIYEVLKREGLVAPGTQAPPPTLLAFSFQQPWNFAAGATITQLLFQPDVFVGLQARQTSLDYNQALIDESMDRIKDSAYKRYYAILITQKQLEFLNASVQRLEEFTAEVNEIYKNGFVERLDVDKAQVQLNNLRTSRSVVENALNLAYAAMKFSIGISQKDTIVLKDALTIEGLKEGILDDSFVYDNRPEIRTLNTLQKLQKLEIKRNKLGFLPTIALSGNYSVNGMGQKFFTDESTFWYKSAFVGVNINLPLFTGFQRRYSIREAELVLDKLNNTIEGVKQVIDFQQVVGRESLVNALLNLDAQEQNLELAQKVFNTTRIKYENGVGSSQEVLMADTDYQLAQSNYFNALYNATVARISYLSSLGKLQ